VSDARPILLLPVLDTDPESYTEMLLGIRSPNEVAGPNVLEARGNHRLLKCRNQLEQLVDSLLHAGGFEAGCLFRRG